MSNSQLTAVYGIGPDSSGLVGRIAGAIAGSGGNILDLNQSAAHGLFSIFCLVDLGSAGTPIEALRAAVEAVAALSGLTLRVDKVEPSKREAQRKNMLLILVGPDKSGIIASMAQTLGQYGVNIEESRTVAREGLFLMELRTDVSASPLPEPNLRKTISEVMAPRGIRTMFQFEDVFNKKKRVIVFSLARSLADPSVLAEISRQAGVPLDAVSGKVSDEERFDRCAQALEGCPAELLDGIADSFKPTGETAELVRTLKLLGYRVALATRALSCFAGRIAEKIEADYAWGLPLEIDPDTRMVSPGQKIAEPAAQGMERFVSGLVAAERVAPEDLVVIDDAQPAFGPSPGLRFAFDPRFVLDEHNRKALSRDALLGVLGGFGRLEGAKAK